MPEYHPIIYIRGFALNSSDIDETTADPFCGFNVGSTVYRARPNPAPPARFVFESPVVRLVRDHGYVNVISQGADLATPNFNGTIPRRAIVVHHYYDQASMLLGDGEVPPITQFASDLAQLVKRMASLIEIGGNGYASKDDFRCYLVAHSMGGLVARAFLQNPQTDPDGWRKKVLKLFTYATPHNGIDFLGTFNVPAFLKFGSVDNFNRKTMADYLNLKPKFNATGSVAWLPQSCLEASQVFTLIGSNRQDYEVAMGLSRTFVGKGSDGLVRIQNADLSGFDEKDNIEPCAKAFVFRSHSGYFGIVNSEEGYQNLQRFLFGNYRVDVWLDVSNVKLAGKDLMDADAAGKLDGVYPVELLVSLRNHPWYLTRRLAVEDSAAVFEHKQLRDAAKNGQTLSKLLSTVFMADWAKKDPTDPTVAYRLELGILMPDYQIDGSDVSDPQYEGSKLFSGAMIVMLEPGGDPWKATYWWESTAPGSSAPAAQQLQLDRTPLGKFVAKVPLSSGGALNVDAAVRFVISPWQ